MVLFPIRQNNYIPGQGTLRRSLEVIVLVMFIEIIFFKVQPDVLLKIYRKFTEN